MSPEEALLRVLALTGLSFPRGVLGPETWALARALSDDAEALSKREHCYSPQLLRQAWDYLARRVDAG